MGELLGLSPGKESRPILIITGGLCPIHNDDGLLRCVARGIVRYKSIVGWFVLLLKGWISRRSVTGTYASRDYYLISYSRFHKSNLPLCSEVIAVVARFVSS